MHDLCLRDCTAVVQGGVLNRCYPSACWSNCTSAHAAHMILTTCLVRLHHSGMNAAGLVHILVRLLEHRLALEVFDHQHVRAGPDLGGTGQRDKLWLALLQRASGSRILSALWRIGCKGAMMNTAGAPSRVHEGIYISMLQTHNAAVLQIYIYIYIYTYIHADRVSCCSINVCARPHWQSGHLEAFSRLAARICIYIYIYI